MKARRAIPWLIAALGFCAYWNCFQNSFVFDDWNHIVENPRIHQLWPPWEILKHSSRPLVHLSLAVNYAFGQLNPWGYHLFNVCIHILAALTLYGVVRRTLLAERLKAKWGASSRWLAAVTAAIWLVHPLQTESVTYTIQRGESMMGLFYLLMLYCVIRSRDSSRRAWWSVAAVASCALGMASKPIMVTAPVVVALYDRVFLSKSWREVAQRRWLVYAGSAATWLLLPMLLAHAQWEWRQTAGFGSQGLPWPQYALSQPSVILHYLRLALWPRPLCFDYGWNYGWPVPRTAGELLPGLVVLGGLLAGTVWALRRHPALGFPGVWFFLILAPTSSVIPIADVVVEHRMYLPLAAVVVLLVMGCFALGKRLWGSRPVPNQVFDWGTAGVAIVLLASLTIQRNVDFRSPFAIWLDTAQKCPNNPRAHNNLGNALLRMDRVGEAIDQYRQALSIRPDLAEAHFGLGNACVQSGKINEGIAQYEQAVRANPDYAEAHCNLGNALLQAGRIQEAIPHYQEALRIEPDYARAHCNFGNALLQANQPLEAIRHYEEAVRIDPNYALAHYDMALALEQAGRIQDAIRHYETTLQINPDYARAHDELGDAYLQVGKLDDAIRQYEEAVRIDPNFVDAQNDLGIALAQAGRFEEAVERYQQALRIDPNFAEAENNWGIALAQLGRRKEAIGHYEQALRIKADFAEAQNNLAWLLATLPQQEGGDPNRALALAHQVCAITENRVPAYLDTLAAAYAAAGLFNEAVPTAQKAVELARIAGQTQLVGAVGARLDLYRAGRAYVPSP